MIELDVKGFSCPMPVLRLKKALLSMTAGDQLKLMSTDVGALKDIPIFCDQMGHKLIDTFEEEGVMFFIVEKAG